MSSHLSRRIAWAAAATAALVAAPLSSAVTAGDAVDLEVSVILDGVYFRELREGNEYPAGFARSLDHGHGRGNWRLQGEYFYREIDVDRRDVSFDGLSVTNEQSFTNRQDGLFVQGVYGLAPRWEAGLRAEALGLTNDIGRGAGESLDASYRYAAMITFRPIEPVFLRAQINHNDFAGEVGRERGIDFMLQLNVSLGGPDAHGH